MRGIQGILPIAGVPVTTAVSAEEGSTVGSARIAGFSPPNGARKSRGRGRFCVWNPIDADAVAVHAFPKTQTRPRAGSVRVEFRSLGWLRENAS
jgi:hypothetical protein